MPVTTKKSSPVVLLTALAAISATLLTTSPAAAAVNERGQMAVPCGGPHNHQGRALYHNCSDARENIFVTYLLGGNTYFCVAPGETKDVGNWSNVFRVYNRGGC
ncbi:hypothetical protein [Nonomuraea sp. NPDC002799]